MHTGLLKQIHWLILVSFILISYFHFPIQKLISGTYQEKYTEKYTFKHKPAQSTP